VGDMPAYTEMTEKYAREYLLGIPLWTKKKNTIEQVRQFLSELGDPERLFKIIHVAGTNGKGSVCAYLTAMLTAIGYHVGTFVSPHLADVKERFLYDGEPVEETEFEACFLRIYHMVQTMICRGFCHPTFFEFAFLMAMDLFGRLRPDFVILEAGLGGRLDTTNVVEKPEICIITSISLDHTQYLGETIPEIAAEKAGIIKPGIPVVYDSNQPEAAAVIARRARTCSAPAYPVSEKESYRQVEFAAPYQAMNAALAVRALEVLSLDGMNDKIYRKALSGVCWKGRMQELAPNIWVDGAHNPGGIREFIRGVNRISAGVQGRIQLLFAAVSDKDYSEMIRLLAEGLPIDRVTVVHLNNERGMDEALLAEQFRKAGCSNVQQFRTVREALTAALVDKHEKDRLYIVGSLYLIGEIIEEFDHGRRDYNAGF